MLELFKAGWILIGCQCFYRSSAENKNHSESEQAFTYATLEMTGSYTHQSLANFVKTE